MSLVEVLVAIGLFAIAAVAALAQYQAARRAMEVAGAVAELQQALRVGFDQLAAGIRAAGLGVHPDENALRPDEGIEAAFAGAVVIRADFDGETTGATDPERALAEGGPFANVTTGNDEIVAYVLAKPGGSSPDAFGFDADVRGVPRDGLVETVTIAGVALIHDDPPYTLYRVTVRPDSTGTVRSPVVENVRSLRLTYFDRAGEAIDPPGGTDDDAARLARASIRRIRIDLEGLAGEPDPRWVDPHDLDPATRRHRKFRISSDVSPRNLDLSGSVDRRP
jgi:type II secretory pathway pseudopilin PulG